MGKILQDMIFDELTLSRGGRLSWAVLLDCCIMSGSVESAEAEHGSFIVQKHGKDRLSST